MRDMEEPLESSIMVVYVSVIWNSSEKILRRYYARSHFIFPIIWWNRSPRTHDKQQKYFVRILFWRHFVFRVKPGTGTKPWIFSQEEWNTTRGSTAIVCWGIKGRFYKNIFPFLSGYTMETLFSDLLRATIWGLATHTESEHRNVHIIFSMNYFYQNRNTS